MTQAFKYFKFMESFILIFLLKHLTPIGWTWTRISTRCFLCAQRTLGVRVISSSLISRFQRAPIGDLFLTIAARRIPVGRGFTATRRGARTMHELTTLCDKWVGLIKRASCKLRTMEGSVFQFTPGQRFVVSPEAQESFNKNGYILVRWRKKQIMVNCAYWTHTHTHTGIYYPRMN